MQRTPSWINKVLIVKLSTSAVQMCPSSFVLHPIKKNSAYQITGLLINTSLRLDRRRRPRLAHFLHLKASYLWQVAIGPKGTRINKSNNRILKGTTTSYQWQVAIGPTHGHNRTKAWSASTAGRDAEANSSTQCNPLRQQVYLRNTNLILKREKKLYILSLD